MSNLTKELSPEEKRSLEVRNEIRQLHRKLADLNLELWKLEGCPPFSLSVIYDGGTSDEIHTVEYTKEIHENHRFLSPDIEGRFNLPKTVLKAKNV